NDAGFNRVAYDHYDRDVARCRFRRQRGWDVERYDNVNLESNEFGCEFREPVQLSFRGAKFECDIVPLRVTEFTHSLTKFFGERFRVRRSDIKDTDTRQFGLLCARCERPSRHR